MIIIPIGRLYSDEETAQKVADTLKERGFPIRNIFTMTPQDREGHVDEVTATAIVSGVAAEIQYHESLAYARKLVDHCSLVVCSAEFGYGELATRIMQDNNPVDAGYIPTIPKRRSTPFSDMLGLPTLSRSQRMNSHGFLGLPLLTSGAARFGKLLHSDYSFSSMIGMKLKGEDPTPLSTKFGLPVLSNDAAPLSRFAGLPLLSKKKQD